MRIGLFGGSFDPVHIEHVRMIENVIKEFSLDKVIVIVAGNPPHKTNVSSFDLRFKQAKEAFKHLKEVEVSDFENNDKTNYAYETIEHFKKEEDELFYIIGADSIYYFDTWKNIDRIFELATLIILPRHNYPRVIKEDYIKRGAKALFSTYESNDISSTMLRVYLDFGLDISEYLPNGVYELIKDEKEYRKHKKELDQLRSDISEKRYIHSANTTVMALELNKQYNFDVEKVYVAAMLHDCGKNTEKYSYLCGDKYKDANYKILHQYVGYEVLQSVYDLHDEDILNAVKYHTTGRPNMSDFEKLICISDFVCLGRDYPGVEEERRLSYESVENEFLRYVKLEYEMHKDKSDPLAVETYNYYFKGEKE